jgi:hypothetical protein
MEEKMEEMILTATLEESFHYSGFVYSPFWPKAQLALEESLHYSGFVYSPF